MISWMQKNNKFLVWTIWVATISFIGTGAVVGFTGGGAKAGTVAKVGDVEISQMKLNLVYSNIYNQYNEAMQGTLDEAKAKEMGLIQQAFSRLETQAKILNFAKEIGIIVSDKEVVEKLQDIKSFQKDEQFNKEIYNAYLKAQRLNAKTFENTLREELVIQKTIALLTVEALPLEIESIAAAMNVSDKLAYKVLSLNDINFDVEESKVKAFWESRKDNFMTTQTYDLSIVWTQSKETQTSDEELKAHYDRTSFNYADAQGKQLGFNEAKEQVTTALKLKKTKKTAQKAYIAFKKGTLTDSEKITLSMNDLKLTKEIWDALKEQNVGDILKPKIVGDMYATIKIENIVIPKVKSYEEAKDEVTKLFTVQSKKEALLTLAEESEKNFDETTATISEFVKLEENVNLKPLNNQESLQFLQKLFTSTKEKGIISVEDKVVVYKILEQKLSPMDENQIDDVKQTVNKLKQNTFESNLIKILDSKYTTQKYMQGI